jgi:hypothetical protein
MGHEWILRSLGVSMQFNIEALRLKSGIKAMVTNKEKRRVENNNMEGL